MNVFEKLLADKREAILKRSNLISNDKIKNIPLSADFADQAVELENNEVIDGLDIMAQKELNLINNAFERIKSGTYGKCTKCHQSISENRLQLLPETPYCMNCAH